MDKLFDWKTILSVVIGGLLLMYVLLPMLTPKLMVLMVMVMVQQLEKNKVIWLKEVLSAKCSVING